MFSHGYGCDQSMWRFVTPAFEHTHRVITFDHVGFGKSDLKAWNEGRHSTLQGYADDLLQILNELDLSDVVFVGHSVASMIGVLAAVTDPSRFGQLVLLCPSPRYIDDPETGYVGGFSAEEIDGLVRALHENQRRWAEGIAPVIMGNPDRPELAAELHSSFCRVDPRAAQAFARATFQSDHRAALPRVTVPSAVIQSRTDAIAPHVVGEYVHEHIANSTLTTLNADGHCPHLSAPHATADAIARAL
ncbi:MAG: alpha/beta hydrolase [Actinomycetota bacterium]|nr:alpha/beta hydrolase [Actinomycetota bacterium]